MTELLAVPLKRASDIDITRPLKNWITATFSNAERPIDVSGALAELQRLRQKAVRLNELGEAGLINFSNYYDQIASLEGKIPSNEVNIPFKWKDAFDRGSLFGGRISLSIPTLAYEKICVLFNVAALNSGVAADQNLDSDDGLQKALKKLQLAAGIFLHLKESVVGAIQQDPTPDLDPETLGVLADLMLAQAQEMVVLKAIKDKMKDQIVAKLCAQCDDLFATTMRSMQRDHVRGMWDNEWLPNISGKQAIYNGLSQYHHSRMCNASKSVGEEIARLQYAQRLLNAGIERGHNPDLANAKEWLRRVEKALADAKKDNDFIYHERIPEEKALTPIGKAAVAKPTPLPDRLGTEKTDLFEELVPVAIHQALAAYAGRKIEVVVRETGKLKEATNVLNATLSSMNLPAALEDTSGSEMPQSLKDKSSSVVGAGGVEELSKMIAELPDLLQRNKEILDEADRLLREECESDNQLRQQFGSKWNRLPSEKLTATFTSNSEKYRTILNNATDADQIVRDKFDKHRVSIEMLSKGPAEMQKNLPSSGGIKGSATVTKLKNMMEEVETIKAERQVIESEIKSVNPDMKPVFFEALNKEGSINEQAISVESLGRAFGPLQKQVADTIARQETLLEEIRRHHQTFVGETGVDGKSAREELLKQWAAGHDAFFEVKGNLQEGTKFYNDLTQLLVTFQNKVSDFCFARRTEKEELLKDLTSGLSRMTLDNSPTAPAHHSATASTLSPTAATAAPSSPSRPPRKNDPPPRPPPPTGTPSSASPTPNPYAGAPTSVSPNPYAGAPTSVSPNPYAGAPTSSPVPASSAPAGPFVSQPQQPANPYAGAPSNVPYPVQPGMQVPYHPYPYPMPAYAAYPPQGYPPAQPGYPGYPPYPQQQGYPAYPPQQSQPGQQPPPNYYPPQSGPQWR